MSYPGGKGGAGVYQTLINLMPPHDVYIEPFLGMGAVMRHKAPAARSYGIDSDLLVTSQWTGHEVSGLTVDTGDGISWLESYDRMNSRTLVYCDPPYVRSSRKSAAPLYRHEMAEEGHIRLLMMLRRLKCMVMVSGYASELYSDYLCTWNRVQFETTTRGGSKATELVWFNFQKPLRLHDYRFLGENFREREKYRRRQARWTARLQNMSPLDRMSMLAALDTLKIDAERQTAPVVMLPGPGDGAPAEKRRRRTRPEAIF